MPKAGERAPLSARQLRAAALIASGWKQTDVARELKINNGTISRWKDEREDFRRAIDTAFDKVMLGARNKAVDVLTRQMDDKNKWLAQNAAGRVLAQYNAAYAREQDGNILVVFGNVESTPSMPVSAMVDSDLLEAGDIEVSEKPL